MLDLGAGPVSTFGDDDVFVTKLTADGTHLWSHGFGSPAADSGKDVAVLPSGGIALVGTFSNSITFGSTTLDSVDAIDGFVALLSP